MADYVPFIPPEGGFEKRDKDFTQVVIFLNGNEDETKTVKFVARDEADFKRQVQQTRDELNRALAIDPTKFTPGEVDLTPTAAPGPTAEQQYAADVALLAARLTRVALGILPEDDVSVTSLRNKVKDNFKPEYESIFGRVVFAKLQL